MQARTWILALAVAFAAAGCATTPPPDDSPVTRDSFRGPLPCADVCGLQVWMTGTGANATVNVSAPRIQMTPRFQYSVIVWRLVNSPEYELQVDAIRPHTGAPVGDKDTTSQAAWEQQMRTLAHTDRVFVLLNNNTGKRETFYYDITVYNKRTKQAYKLDPAIMNDP